MIGTQFRARESLLWLLIAIYAVASLLPSFAPRALSLDTQLALVVFLPLAFALIHGAMRHGVAGIAIFLVLCFGISNTLENLGVLTGFPFGHYVYTGAMGPKLFVVPLLIGPAYFGAGYTSWVLAAILLRETDRAPDRLAIFGVPAVAAFVMVGWDLCFDPGSSTLDRLWIWQKGGGYFGVPLTNYLGWYLTVFVFLFLFSLYRARRQAAVAPRLSSFYWAQPAVLFFVMALTYQADYLADANVVLTDATGATWRSADLHETAAIVSLFTMVFVAVTCLLILARRERTRVVAG
jgi:uncharacterized membrane protein